MYRYFSHINTAKTILQQYAGEVPFSNFLKNFFTKEKKYGSRDRRTISSLCYNYFRLGSALNESSIDDRLITSTFILSAQPNELLEIERPQWNEKISCSLQEKIEWLQIDVNEIFPFNNELSVNVDRPAFNKSFLIQPDLFIRTRPGKHQQVLNKLNVSKQTYKEINNRCIVLANSTKLDEIIDINRDAVIQDLSSQRVGEMMLLPQLPKAATVWDCCAASGGKSIMAYDFLNEINLTVSDVRQSIIHNLHVRFKEAGIKRFQSFVADITDSNKLKAAVGTSKFDLIICDVPCSGSGTWSRTPEQLLFFKQHEITRYADRQKKIALNAIQYLKPAGYFLYVTCSVFEKENEQLVQFIQQQSKLQLIKMELLKGYHLKADTMFAALFKVMASYGVAKSQTPGEEIGTRAICQQMSTNKY